MSGTDQPWDIVSGVGITALAVASARAVETSRPDALVEDPYAARFVEEARPPVPLPTSIDDVTAAGSRGEMWLAMSAYMAVRTRAFDDYFDRAVGAGVEQVVLLAAGLDVRAFRLHWPRQLTWYEIDQPAVLDFKLRVLRDSGATPTCDHHVVAVDLRQDWAAALEAAGFDRSRPTAWLAEGLLPYLPAEAEDRLFHEIHRLSARGSRLAVEHLDDISEALNDTAMKDSAEAMGIDIADLVHTDPRPTPSQRLSELGWQSRNVSATQTAAAYGRPLEPPSFMQHAVHVFAYLP
ncbi:SAM-dependent methyltransferase [Streptomyces sp. RB6PN25]|uniref:S-adenosyl-L-methionine-dependent methyltransferase n=1 Tax=Streptomyces humicola TaxID=2953240 RepID=A0ABT1PTB3_9ACTN|nr:SAM-dependent methyltransferase [Streptomyces humicola]MCQ4079790.1 SAM-dependent methyltransferase [Streptomyces humicola]